MNQPTALMDEWVTRVLGCGLPGGDEAPARFESTRPNETPRTAMTGNLLAMMARVAPVRSEELPAILSEMIPRFLLVIQNEPHMDARPMTQGAPVTAQDQVLAVADLFNAVLRSARRWEELLGQAEQADGRIDKMEQSERDAPQQKEYEELVVSYNAARLAALDEEARCMQLVNALFAEFSAAQGTAAQ